MSDSKEILKTYKKIAFDSKKISPVELKKKYQNFFENHEKLFEMASTSPNYEDDVKTLDMMLKTKDNMDKGVTDKFHADVIVGNNLGKRYVYKHTLGRDPNAGELKDAIDKLKKSMEED